MSLPNTYKQVEYIESTGTQYIDTWFIPSNTTKIQISMWWWNYVQEYAHLFWVRAVWNATDASIWRWFFLCHQYNSSYIWMFWRWYSSSSGWWSSTTFSFVNWNNHIIEMSQSGAYEDGTLKASLQTVTFTSPSNMCIFALNDNGTVKENSSYKLYYFKIWNNWTLVRDFIPVIRISDNKPWLYDLVNDTFYTNQGTWEFTYKEYAESWQIQHIYLGTNQIRPKESGLSYSYDFRSKSTATIASDWYDWNNTPLFDSSWIYYTTWSSTVRKKNFYSISNANKITLKATFNLTFSESWWFWFTIMKWDWSSDVGNTWMYFQWDWWTEATVAGSRKATTSINRTNWNYTETMIFDLVNKTYNYSWYYSLSWSLTDAEIETIRNCDSVRVYLAAAKFKMQSISVETE